VHADTIDEVIILLKKIIIEETKQRSPMTYFTILYHDVTVAIRNAIQEQRFEDNPRMEKLDVIFANHYFDAYKAYKEGQQTSQCWQLAFESTTRLKPTVLQHILAGMNAHINFDLSQAVIDTDKYDITSLKHDFMLVNTILSEQVNAIEDKLAEIWPVMRLLDWIAGKTDEALIDFSMLKAREAAWKNAEILFKLNEVERKAYRLSMDKKGEYYGNKVINPPLLVRGITFLIRIGEGWDVQKKIAKLYP
jgi:hypothetical protein